ncbi:hypothetical protein HK096_002892 [Nowakowskiella sp. JEL0078]|nr:hypothetical protein HK096_002892 [Nowakowskiella sp. JEL0078]
MLRSLCSITHSDIGTETHMTNFFLPWHRYFIYMFEKRLQLIDKDVVLPYFDWTIDSHNVSHSSVWEDFGGGGIEIGNEKNPSYGCITRGPYAGITGELPQHDCIKRQSRPGILPSVDLYAHLTLAYDDYVSFRERMEVAHNIVHAEIGGTYPGSMAYFYSPNDPIFYVHHAQIDRLWSLWQDRHPDSVQYPELHTIINFGKLNIVDHLVTVNDIIHYKQDLCYEYENSVIPIYDDDEDDKYSKPYKSLRQSLISKEQNLRFHKIANIIDLSAFSPILPSPNRKVRRDWSLAKHSGLRGEDVEKVPTLDSSIIVAPDTPPDDDPLAKYEDTKVDGSHHDPTKLRSLRPMADSWKFLGMYDKPFLRAIDAEYDRFTSYVNTIKDYESICSLHNLMRAQSYRTRTDEEEKSLWDSFAVIEKGYNLAVKKAEETFKANNITKPVKADEDLKAPTAGYST